MSDLSGTASVGVESVEWFDAGAGNLTVRVGGRWRRRRPAGTGPVALVVEAEGRRHRFPAMPEPPSVGGTAPGMWRLSFSLPGWLAPWLGGNAWLSWGTITVPLPVTGAAAGSEAPSAEAARPEAGPLDAARPEATVWEVAVGGPTGDAAKGARDEPSPGREEPSPVEHEEPLPGREEPSPGHAEPPPVEPEEPLPGREEPSPGHAEPSPGDEEPPPVEHQEPLPGHAESSPGHAEPLGRVEPPPHEEPSLEHEEPPPAEEAASEQRAPPVAPQRAGMPSEIERAWRRAEAAERAAAEQSSRARELQRALAEAEATAGPALPGGIPGGETARLAFERELTVRRGGARGHLRVPAEPRADAAAADGPPPPGPAGAGAAPSETPPLVGEPGASEPGPAPPSTAGTDAASPGAASPGAASPGAAGSGAAGSGTAVGGAAVPPLGPPLHPVSADRLVDTLRRELDARACADAGLRSRLVAAESRLAARTALDKRTESTLAQVRAELAELRTMLERERRLRLSAERHVVELEDQLGGQRERSREAYAAIGRLRHALDGLRPATPPEPPADPSTQASTAADVAAEAGPVTPDRLADALTRLREAVPPREGNAEETPAGEEAPAGQPAPAGEATPGEAPVPQPAPETGPAPVSIPAGQPLRRAFRRLVRSDPDAAGQLVLELLPLQRVVDRGPLAYDLVLGPGRGCVRVTVRDGETVVERAEDPRPLERVFFRVRGEPARIARLLNAHGIWRYVGLRVARVRGRRRGLAVLQALLGLPLDPGWLGYAGARLSPRSVLSLAGAVVEPAWTRGQDFVIAHEDTECASPGERGTYLIVRPGRRVAVSTTPPAGETATTRISGSADALAAVLAGGGTAAALVGGDPGPLATLRGWLDYARSG
ncbi:MAG: hypothetical protein JOZ07_10300 [Solirubrobacterales bacterium]|nr:hypothetical protein [Solirubrobacterales bacterium]